MAVKPDASGYENFSDVTARLDEIVSAVRNKDTSLERSLDLFDEAIALGTRAVDLVDKAAFSPEEKERLVSPPEDEEAGQQADKSAEGDASGQQSADKPAESDAAQKSADKPADSQAR